MAKATTPAGRRSANTTSPARPTGRTPRTVSRQRTPDVLPLRMPFESSNTIYILLGVGVLILGYVLMAMGSTMSFLSLTIAPIILVIGYFFVIPYGILYGSKSLRNRKEIFPDEETVV